MKYAALILLMMSTVLLAGSPKQDPLAATPAVQDSTKSSEIQNTARSLTMDELRSFYIGFADSQEGKRLITLNITKLDSVDNEIKFQYTMNSLKSLEEGEGTIDPVKNIVQLNDLDTGKIFRATDGKIVFESINQDSLSYWKMKEK